MKRECHEDDDAPTLTPASVRATTSPLALAWSAADSDRSLLGSLRPAGTAVPLSVLLLRLRARLRCRDSPLVAIAGTIRRGSPDLLEGSFEKIQLHLLAAQQPLQFCDPQLNRAGCRRGKLILICSLAAFPCLALVPTCRQPATAHATGIRTSAEHLTLPPRR